MLFHAWRRPPPGRALRPPPQQPLRLRRGHPGRWRRRHVPGNAGPLKCGVLSAECGVPTPPRVGRGLHTPLSALHTDEMTGTLINVATVVAGSLLGMAMGA